MTLLRTSFLSFIATAVKILSALAINKAVALYIGPSGLALLGQFQNFIQLAMTAAQGGINQGVTKYAAEYSREGKSLSLLLGTAAKISLACSVLVGLGICLFAQPASEFFLDSTQYAYVFIIFGITIVLFVLNQLLLSIINGLKEITTFISISITQSFYSLGLTTLMIVLFGLDGALVAMVTNQSVIFLVVLWRLRNHAVIQLESFMARFDSGQARKLFGYSIMTFTSAATVPVSHLVIRNYLGNMLGWEEAGYWQAIWYISHMYLTVVTMALSIYYLPRLSEITKKAELRRELAKGYKVIMPAVTIMALGIYLLKDFIVWLLFSEDFTPMRELFQWQLIGDVIKLAAWLLSFLMLAKAMTRAYVITEILFSALFVGLSLFFVNMYGLVGVTYAFAINYSFYLLTMVWLMWHEVM